MRGAEEPQLHVEEHGEGDALLLIQGLGQGSWVWREHVPAFAEHWRTIVFDTRGTGRSPAASEPYGIADLADDAVRILRGREAHVVGFSMGGYVALTLALARPELVRSLVLAGTGAGGRERVPRPEHVRRVFAEAWGLPTDEFARRTLPYTFASGWAERNPERFEAILAARAELPTSYETIEAHAEACYGFYAAEIEVERIEAPALVVHGDADLIVPVENGRRLADRLPHAELSELPGRGHNLMLEEPDEFTHLVVDFLSRASRRRRRPRTPSRRGRAAARNPTGRR